MKKQKRENQLHLHRAQKLQNGPAVSYENVSGTIQIREKHSLHPPGKFPPYTETLGSARFLFSIVPPVFLYLFGLRA